MAKVRGDSAPQGGVWVRAAASPDLPSAGSPGEESV